MSVNSGDTRPHAGVPPFAEFVAIIALMMAMTAYSIDNLLPAFGAMQREFGVPQGNEIQLTLYVYVIAFSVMQLIYGPLSDMIGRRPTLMVGLAIYAVGSLLALVAESFAVLLVARMIQGAGIAAARVLAVAVVRDCYAGREMARVMSFAMTVFIIVPVFAPGIGSLLMLLGDWHMIFVSMLLLGLILAVWVGLRLPETLHDEYRVPLSARRVASGFAVTIGTRATLGYATATSLMMGCLMAYIGSSQQIFETTVYGLGPWFPVAFGLVAIFMGAAAFINSQLVRRLGMRRLAHAGLIGFSVVALLQLVSAYVYDGRPPLLLFGLLLAGCQFLFSICVPNFNALAMEPLGRIAGTASSFIGFYTTLLGALAGLAIGQSFDGTVLPLAVGYFVLGVSSLLIVLATEGGRLFVAHGGEAGRG